ncbi:MAG: GAF domain-containing protein [Candidatus Sulfotelmatobacter sp.]
MEDTIEQGGPTRNFPARASAAIPAGVLGASVRFPGEDGGQSLAAMAQRDLDAALQLLADRAQYITGAGGAAIALRRSGKNDMLCRASTGSNAPELGALLSTEFGLSGESVRTRQPLRCDDAERDRRVNHEVCRQMGIASVAIMPVVQDDQVLGVFELFSGKANAFGERDLSALRRLSEMVETAVRLAHAAETLPDQLKGAEPPAEAVAEEILDVTLPVVEPDSEPDSEPAIELAGEAVQEPAMEAAMQPAMEAVLEVETEVETEAAAELPAEISAPAPPQAATPQDTPPQDMPGKPEAPQRPLFWSAALNANGEAQKPAEPDQSHVPPVLRHLHRCEVCGFPVSSGRVLCVECEEKRWRGQRNFAPAAAKQAVSQSRASAPAVRAFAAAAQAGAAAAPAPVQPPMAVAVPREPAVIQVASEATPVAAEETAPQEVTFSAGLEPSPSWFRANKYILGALLVVAGTVAAIVLLR